MSPGLKSTILDIGQTVQNLPEANMGQVDSWARQINAAAQRERYPTDKVVAGQLDGALSDLIKQGGAGDLRTTAQDAYQKSVMAENLADWQSKVSAGGSIGQAPFGEAENWYKNQPDQYKTLIDLYQQSQNPQSKTTYALGHLGANALGAIGGSIAGFPGVFAGEAVGYLGLKPMIAKMMKGYDKNQLLKAYQAAYPQLTGVPLTGAKEGPKVGDAIKNLMLGTAF
jgi:hypothetical protein